MSAKSYDSTTATAPPPAAGVCADPNPMPPFINPEAAASAAAHVADSSKAAAEERENPAAEAIHRIKGDINELKEYASYYVAAKVDGVKRTVRNIGLYAVLGIVGLIAGGAIVATAAGLLIVGLADGLGGLFGGRYWLGDIVAGLLVLGVIGGGAWMMMNKLTGAWKSQTLKKYEQRKQNQRERFGHDVSGRAREAAAAAAAERKAAAGRG